MNKLNLVPCHADDKERKKMQPAKADLNHSPMVQYHRDRNKLKSAFKSQQLEDKENQEILDSYPSDEYPVDPNVLIAECGGNNLNNKDFLATDTVCKSFAEFMRFALDGGPSVSNQTWELLAKLAKESKEIEEGKITESERISTHKKIAALLVTIIASTSVGCSSLSNVGDEYILNDQPNFSEKHFGMDKDIFAEHMHALYSKKNKVPLSEAKKIEIKNYICKLGNSTDPKMIAGKVKVLNDYMKGLVSMRNLWGGLNRDEIVKLFKNNTAHTAALCAMGGDFNKNTSKKHYTKGIENLDRAINKSEDPQTKAFYEDVKKVLTEMKDEAKENPQGKGEYKGLSKMNFDMAQKEINKMEGLDDLQKQQALDGLKKYFLNVFVTAGADGNETEGALTFEAALLSTDDGRFEVSFIIGVGVNGQATVYPIVSPSITFRPGGRGGSFYIKASAFEGAIGVSKNIGKFKMYGEVGTNWIYSFARAGLNWSKLYDGDDFVLPSYLKLDQKGNALEQLLSIPALKKVYDVINREFQSQSFERTGVVTSIREDIAVRFLMRGYRTLLINAYTKHLKKQLGSDGKTSYLLEQTPYHQQNMVPEQKYAYLNDQKNKRDQSSKTLNMPNKAQFHNSGHRA